MGRLSRPQTARSAAKASFAHQPKQSMHDYYDYSEDEEEEFSVVDSTRPNTAGNVKAHFRHAPSLSRSQFVKVGNLALKS